MARTASCIARRCGFQRSFQKLQAAATRMMGYGDTHVGILSDKDALKELSRVLDATTAGKS